MNPFALPLVVALLATPPADAPTPASPLAAAVARVQANDRAGAIAILEPVVRKGDAAQPILSLLAGLYLEENRALEAWQVVAARSRDEDADPALLFYAGRASLALGDTERGRALLERAVALAPVSPAARELGLMLARENRCPRALETLRGWAAPRPDDLEARRAAAFCALELQRPDEAERFLAELPADDPGVRLLTARLAVVRGEGERALSLLQPLLAQAETVKLRDVKRIGARAHLLVGNPAAALALLAGATEGDPQLKLLLAEAQAASGDPAAALATLEPVLARFGDPAAIPADRRPFAGQLFLRQGLILSDLGRRLEALAALERAAGLAPSAEGERRRAALLGELGRSAEAAEVARRAAELGKPASPGGVAEDPTGARLRAALFAAAAGKRDEALVAVRRERTQVPDDPRPPLAEAQLLLQFGRASEALEVVESAVAKFRELADPIYQRGAVRLQLGDRAGAEADFRKALERDGEHVAALSDLGVLLAGTGRREEAKQLLRKVLALRPGDELARRNLAALEGAPGSRP